MKISLSPLYHALGQTKLFIMEDMLHDAHKGNDLLNPKERWMVLIHCIHYNFCCLSKRSSEILLRKDSFLFEFVKKFIFENSIKSISGDFTVVGDIILVLVTEKILIEVCLCLCGHMVQRIIIKEYKLGANYCSSSPLITQKLISVYSCKSQQFNNNSMSIKILFVVLAIAAGLVFLYNTSTHQMPSFRQFQEHYSKKYHPGEQYYRHQIYQNNKHQIQVHNANPNNNYTLQVNAFADLTLLQFRQMYMGLKISIPSQIQSNLTENMDLNYQIQVDWKKQGKVTQVKNQRMCASCWAFCSIAALQSAYLINQGVNLLFSEQQLVDCSTPYGNKGCHGGQLQYTFLYMQQKGVNTEKSYPYVAQDQNCKSTNRPYKMASYKRELTCGGLFDALMKGPVAVAVDALFWSFYKEGIFDNCASENEVNHGVLVVGAYKEYWWVKNSWGIEWGDNGYIKIRRGNTCHICQYPYRPILE